MHVPSNPRWEHPQKYAFSYASSLLVTWQRCRSHHSIRHSWKPHATHKPDGSVCYRTWVKGDQSLHCENGHVGRFRLLWPWPSPDDLHIRGTFNKFQDCSSYEAPSEYWISKLTRSCTLTSVRHLPGFVLWRHTVTSVLCRCKQWRLMFSKSRE